MVTETSDSVLSAVYGEPDSNGAFTGSGRESAKVKYWRKQDGWIIVGPDGRTDNPRWQQYRYSKKYRELPDHFGLEVINAYVKGTGRKGDMANAYVKPGEENFWLRPFLSAGGLTYVIKDTDDFGKAGEFLFTKEQAISMGFHRRPELVALRPDFAEAVDLDCPYRCGRGPFAGATQEIAQRSVDQHIVANHKDAVASRAVGDTIAQAMQAHQGTAVDANMIATIAAAVVQAMTGVQKAAVTAVVQEQQSIDLDTANRQDLMKYASANGIPRPSNAMQMDTEQWRDYVKTHASEPQLD